MQESEALRQTDPPSYQDGFCAIVLESPVDSEKYTDLGITGSGPLPVVTCFVTLNTLLTLLVLASLSGMV